MGNSLRCCLACVLPCGALDLIRIVHLNGYVEEMTRAVTAGEILKDYPSHVLSKPTSQGMVRKILILSPNTELKRGSIYFLIPNSSLPPSSDHHRQQQQQRRHHHIHASRSKLDPLSSSSSSKKVKTHKELGRDHHDHIHDPMTEEVERHQSDNKFVSLDLSSLSHEISNGMVGEARSKSKSARHRRRRSSRGKSGIWQPHLHSITED